MKTRVRKILLVEDEAANAVLMQNNLLYACPGQFELKWADSMQKTLDMLGTESFDAILLDLSLPDSQGLQTIERILASSPTAPIVVLTSTADEQTAVKTIAKGAQDYLIKSETDSRSIVRAIQYAIYRKQTEEAIRRAKDELEHQVMERTAELSKTVETLQVEIARRTLAEQTLLKRSEQLRALASKLTLTEQRERQRLAEVLHDNLQQLLVAAKYRMVAMERSPDETVHQAAAEVQDLLNQSIQCSRSLTGELSPPLLNERGLLPALEWLAEWMEQKHNLTVVLQVDEDVKSDTEDLTILIFQSIRELLFNTVKHAKVKTAYVEVLHLDGQIQVVVSDKGVGFNPKQVRIHEGVFGGFGLFSIRERLDLLGGSLEIESASGRGSRFTLRAPLRRVTPESQNGVSFVPATTDETPTTSGEIRPNPPGFGVGKKIRILLVDDHLVVRQGLSQVLNKEPDMEIVGEASEGQTAVNLTRQLRPDVIIMDISMPGMNGIEATRIIHSEMPHVRVLGLSMFEETKWIDAMHQAGAAAYLLKRGPTAALLAEIRASVGTGDLKHSKVNPPEPHEPKPKSRRTHQDGSKRAK